ncbi:MAG: PAS domain S-box protein [Dictyoglomaceae bacterium]
MKDIKILTLYQTFKGFLFVISSALIFYFLLSKELKARFETEEKLKTYINFANDIVVILNKEGKVSYINDNGCEILGYRREEVVGKDWFGNFVPEKTKEELTFYEWFKAPLITKNGEEKIILWHSNYNIFKEEWGGEG